MKFLAHPDEHSKPAFEMTAMVDMVFILLAFFVMASQFDPAERDIIAGPAAVTLAQGATAQDFPSDIPVRIRRVGDGMTVAVGRTTPTSDLSVLSAKLNEINMPEITVRILADPELTVAQVAAALDAVLVTPMKKVSIGKLPIATASTLARTEGR